jgi:hypothetical protein
LPRKRISFKRFLLPLAAEGGPRQGFVEDADFDKLFDALPPHLQPLIFFRVAPDAD